MLDDSWFFNCQISGKEKCQIFQNVSSFPVCTAAGKKKGREKKKKTIIDHITGLSVHELVLKEVMAFVHAR